MKIKFNKNKCLKLLKKKKELEKEGKLLRNYNENMNDELINYFILIEDQIFWENRKEYLKLLTFFINKKISINQFSEQFCGLRSTNINLFIMFEKHLEKEALSNLEKKNKINILINPDSSGFTEIISYLHSLIDIYNPDVTLEMNLQNPELLFYGISEEFLRFRIEEYFLLELKKYC